MDFFARQDSARKKTKLLVFYFVVAVILIIALNYVVGLVVLTGAQSSQRQRDRYETAPPLVLWNPQIFLGASVITLAIVSIGIVAGSAAEPPDTSTLSRRQEIQCGLGAAVGFGLYLILISETSHGAGLWTAVAARTAPVLLLLVVLPIMRRPMTVPREAFRWVAISGFTDAGANALLVAAVRTGLLSIVAPVANLFPAVTVLLARAVGHEKIGRFRLAGLAMAVVSLVLIAL